MQFKWSSWGQVRGDGAEHRQWQAKPQIPRRKKGREVRWAHVWEQGHLSHLLVHFSFKLLEAGSGGAQDGSGPSPTVGWVQYFLNRSSCWLKPHAQWLASILGIVPLAGMLAVSVSNVEATLPQSGVPFCVDGSTFFPACPRKVQSLITHPAIIPLLITYRPSWITKLISLGQDSAELMMT